MKSLMLCRHAKSSWKYDTEDLYRPLNARGINQAPLMAKNLANNTRTGLTGNESFRPELVLCSPAVRAWSTALCYFQECDWDYNCLQINPNLHEVSVATLIQELRKIPCHIATVALFGHNPGLNDLIGFLDAEEQVQPNLVTSGRVMLELNVHAWRDITASCASIKEWIIPIDLASS